MIRRNHQPLFILAAAVLACLLSAGNLPAASTVTYNATGNFATPQLDGADMLKLAGEPFSLSVVASTTLVPTAHGHTWAEYTNLSMTGTVYSGLLPGVPIPIASSAATLVQVEGRNQPMQLLAFEFPILVLNIQLDVIAKIAMPPGTIPNALINPFTAPVTLTSPPDFLSYSDSTATTTLGLGSGTVSTTTSSARPVSAASGAPQFYFADLFSGESSGSTRGAI
jgi:hypothetical protein